MKFLNNSILVFILFSMLGSACFAQIKIAGKILDSETGKPIAESKIVTNQSHTHSDDNGLFELQLNQLTDSIKIIKSGYEIYFLNIDSLQSFFTIYLTEKQFTLQEIEVNAENQFNTSQFSVVDLKNRPVQSSQDLLRIIPGMFIAQHAGGGKAEQMFIRGFDIDHGTDFKLSVDGIPVNMVSHAHGQGYADLHFVIPELVKNVNYQLGPYNVENGNFATAGAANFITIDKPKNSFSKLEYGNLGHKRALMVLDMSSRKNNANIGYLAAEGFFNNGAFVHPQNYNRYNLNSKYLFQIAQNQTLQLVFSAFTSKWDASGQIPLRAVESGFITKWGSIDPSEGGNTSRYNLSFIHNKKFSDNVQLKTQFYAVNYGFNLFSNFTFFLNDSINGDQINQKENRTILGGESKMSSHHFNWGDFQFEHSAAVGFRNDLIHNIALANTVQRRFLSYKTFGDVQELNSYSYLNEMITYKKWILILGLRYDNIQFNWQNKLDSLYQNKEHTASILQPKVGLFYNVTARLQFFAKYGKGFHSNDARVSTSNSALQTLPAAHGIDVGFMAKPVKNMLLQLNYWQLNSQQEFVFVGDEAIVELAGKSARKGLDFLVRYQINQKFQLDFDVNYSHARLLNVPNNENLIPLAPRITSIGGITFAPFNKLSFSARYRHLGDRAANESNSIVAKGYQIVDFSANYQFNRMQFQVAINNLLDTPWKEAQFATESKLKNESKPVEEIHYTPGNPFFIKTSITININ